MKELQLTNRFVPRAAVTAIGLTVLSVFAPSVQAAPPDLTAASVIATIDRSNTYNLGATGLRGWIYADHSKDMDGTQTAESRQILVTVASTPGSAVLAVDDVILGAMAGSSVRIWPTVALTVPSWEARLPLLAVAADGHVGKLPSTQSGLSVSRPGIVHFELGNTA